MNDLYIQIKKFGVTRLTLGAHYEFHATANKLMLEATIKELGITYEHPRYAELLRQEETFINNNRSKANTAMLHRLDKERDQLLSQILTKINIYARSPIQANQTVGEYLKFIVAPYRKIASDEYNKQTSEITGLVRDLKAEETIERVKTIGLEEELDLLEKKNKEFQKAMRERFEVDKSVLSFTTFYTTRELRRQVDFYYRHIILRANSNAVVNSSEVIDVFVLKMNELIDEYRMVIANSGKNVTGGSETDTEMSDETEEEAYE